MNKLLLLIFLTKASGIMGQTTRLYAPKVFYNAYNASTEPVLRISPGDTVITESLDALGFDKDSVRRGTRGNPLTGPFYIETAKAGDLLAVTITRISLNRNFATTLNAFVPKILDKPEAMKFWRTAKLVRWELDLQKQTARPPGKYPTLNDVVIPVKPFLGSVGVAPPGSNSISSGGFGTWGGNLDFSAITESATLYLPVYHDGAYLYLGDGHALQGDGELNGDALETSMDFSFTIRVIERPARLQPYPRVENSQSVMAFGHAKNLDLALKKATQNLITWLRDDYGLSIEEASQLIGPAASYQIPKIAATEVEIVAIIPKGILRQIRK